MNEIKIKVIIVHYGHLKYDLKLQTFNFNSRENLNYLFKSFKFSLFCCHKQLASFPFFRLRLEKNNQRKLQIKK